MVLFYKENIALVAHQPRKVLLPKIAYVYTLIFDLEFTSRSIVSVNKEVLVEAKNVFDTATSKPLVVKNNGQQSTFNLTSLEPVSLRSSYIELTANCNTTINFKVWEA